MATCQTTKQRRQPQSTQLAFSHENAFFIWGFVYWSL